MICDYTIKSRQKAEHTFNGLSQNEPKYTLNTSGVWTTLPNSRTQRHMASHIKEIDHPNSTNSADANLMPT
jgi:hypothetical protein